MLATYWHLCHVMWHFVSTNGKQTSQVCYICRQLSHYIVCPFRIIHWRRVANICYLLGHIDCFCFQALHPNILMMAILQCLLYCYLFSVWEVEFRLKQMLEEKAKSVGKQMLEEKAKSAGKQMLEEKAKSAEF